MTLNTPTGKEMAPEEILELIERHFLRALAALDEALLRLKDGEKDGAQNVAKTTKEARMAMQSVIEERKRVDQVRKHATGTCAEGELDLDAARDEIGRRLAVLQAQERAGSLSEQPE